MAQKTSVQKVMIFLALYLVYIFLVPLYKDERHFSSPILIDGAHFPEESNLANSWFRKSRKEEGLDFHSFFENKINIISEDQMKHKLRPKMLSEAYCGAPLPQALEYPPELRLVLVQVITRHGDRAPYNVMPEEDVYWNCNLTDVMSMKPGFAGGSYDKKMFIPDSLYAKRIWKGSCGPAQLTLTGAKQHLALGRALRSIYVDRFQFLSPNFSPQEVYVRSTETWRTIQSAEANLLGLYPVSMRPSSLTIDINVEPKKISDASPNADYCPMYTKALAARMNTTEWIKRQQKVLPLKQKLNEICGTADLQDWSTTFDHFGDNFHCRVCHSLPLPCKNRVCVNSTDVEAIFEQAGWEKEYLASTREVTKLGIGAFVMELVEVVSNYIVGRIAPKYLFYSAHDDTLSLLLGAFLQHDGNWPPYASHMIWEIFQDSSSNAFIRVLYNGKPLLFPFCNNVFCPWEIFLDFAKANVYIHDYNLECFAQSKK